MKAWHFVSKTLRDGRPIPKNGELLKFNDIPILCEQGLHASLDPFDALHYAPGNTLCLVECGGKVYHQSDKLVCTKRTIIVRMDATPLLMEFARMQALSCIHLWDPPQIVCDYLFTGEESIKDAASAAASADVKAAWAAEAAAWDAVKAAASADVKAAEAARWAARTASAAVKAAEAALPAWDAAGAAWNAARKDFNLLVNGAFEDWL